jgi:hypothetical protein
MRELWRRIWNEATVAIGFISTVALIIATAVTNAKWDAGTVVAVLAPLATALGVKGISKSNNHKEDK